MLLFFIFCFLGETQAIPGGNFTVGFAAYPRSLNYYLANEEFTLAVNQLVLESLIELHPDTYLPVARLAKSWKVSQDKRAYTFTLDPRATFSDGAPVTASDVRFTWEMIHHPTHKTVAFQALFSSFQSCHAIDAHTVEFTVRHIHFQNLEKLAQLFILPRHIYAKRDFNKEFNSRIAGSGPYVVESAITGDKITLKRDPKYWGFSLNQNAGRYNFDRIVYKAVPDANVQYEIFKKGDIDYFYFLSAKMWATQTSGPLYDRKCILKMKGENSAPVATQGIAWNMRRPLFQDRRVRLALSHLLNRKRFINEIFYDNYRLSTAIVSPDSPYHPRDLAPLAYDPPRARALLAEAGWIQVGHDGILIRKGQPFEFDMIVDNPAHERYLTIYQEDLKRLGIRMHIRIHDWAQTLRLVDDRQFDAYLFARSRTVHPYNLADEWGGAAADIKGSGNSFGYKNPALDRLFTQVDETFEIKKRLPLVHEIVKTIAYDTPMTPTWEVKYFRIAYWNRFSFSGQGYFTYSTWRDAFQYWWFDHRKQEKLRSCHANR